MLFVKKLKTKIKFPCSICNNKEYLVEHHINGRDIPFANHESNLCAVCQNCHYEIHLGEIIIERWVMSSAGKELIWYKKGDDSFTGESASPHQINSKSD